MARQLLLPLSGTPDLLIHKAITAQPVYNCVRQLSSTKVPTMAKRVQPEWNPPQQQAEVPRLRLFNSLTRQKEVFVPQNGKQVTWYNCGPTVYDASHMGHARTYLTFDILRRVLGDYFKYDIKYVMNITDIDDKIIKRARQNYLYDNYVAKKPSLETLLDDCKQVLLGHKEVLAKTTDPDKKAMHQRLLDKMTASLTSLEQAVQAADQKLVDEASQQLLVDAKDLMSDWLDRKHGSEVTDNSIFSKLPRYWEERYHEDMKALNILPADFLTRVSEYVPENVAFIEKIIEQGYGYESNGSVYFDVTKFDGAKDHYYAKLVPEAFGDSSALAEGEGDLSVGEEKQKEKRCANDFALWKKSKPGEPSWESPWGRGRPGWHIECSVMASAILGSSIDIHSGGIDLKFPHHDNELAQAEAYHGNDHWIRYFLHSGHLTIAGCKMSKSLKNFITIQEVLQKYSARQLRLIFLLHSWKDTLDYSDNTMELARSYEKTVNEFLFEVQHILRTTSSTEVTAYPKSNAAELTLDDALRKCKREVDEAFCDNIDTRTALEAIRDLVASGNAYIKGTDAPNRMLLYNCVTFIDNIFETLGLKSGAKGDNNREENVMPYVNALSSFRSAVREEAIRQKATFYLQECDKLRDDVLPELGVRLEDKEGKPPVIKLVDKEELMRERALKLQMIEQKRLQKEKQRAEAEAKKEAQDAQKRIPPSEMFKNSDKYSKFDDKGIPTHDNKGEELPKSQLKKLQKLYQAQEKKHNEYLKSREESK